MQEFQRLEITSLEDGSAPPPAPRRRGSIMTSQVKTTVRANSQQFPVTITSISPNLPIGSKSSSGFFGKTSKVMSLSRNMFKKQGGTDSNSDSMRNSVVSENLSLVDLTNGAALSSNEDLHAAPNEYKNRFTANRDRKSVV